MGIKSASGNDSMTFVVMPALWIASTVSTKKDPGFNCMKSRFNIKVLGVRQANRSVLRRFFSLMRIVSK